MVKSEWSDEMWGVGSVSIELIVEVGNDSDGDLMERGWRRRQLNFLKCDVMRCVGNVM
jgi:hypothetical protein